MQGTILSRDEEWRRQSEMLSAQVLLCDAFNSVGERVFILNESRQIVFANSRASGGAEVLGQPLGKAIGCVHAALEEDLCSANPACRTCGVLATLMEGAGPQASEREVTLARERGQAANLRIRVSRILVNGEALVVAAIADTSASLRRAYLEGVFFHDILNMAAALKGLAELYDWSREGGPIDVLRELGGGTQWLVDEIASFQMLAAAEKDELHPEFRKVWLPTFLREMAVRAEILPRARGRRLLPGPVPEVALVTDPRILAHILLRMVERVLEVTPPGGEVKLIALSAVDRVRFEVCGPVAPISDANSASLGSYSTQLFSQKYLEGRAFIDPAAGSMVAEFPLVPEGWSEERERPGTPAPS